MQIRAMAGNLQQVKGDVAVLMVPTYETVKDKTLKQLDTATKGAVTALLDYGEFSGKAGEYDSIFNPAGYGVRRIVLTGLGNEEKIAPDSFRVAMGSISRLKAINGSKRVIVYFDRWADERYYQAAVEGYLLGSYKSLEFRSGEAKKDTSKIAEMIFVVPDAKRLPSLQAAIKRGQVIAEGQNLVRRLGYMPSNYLTPKIYAKKMQELARKYGVQCRVLDEVAIEREKMGCLLGVAKGSDEPPRFVVLQYKGRRDAQKPVVLVGKGVTFDSGGISIKPAQDMGEMKGDMTGSAVMLSTILTAARLKLPLNLVALCPLTENMPSGHATKPGDILTSRKGLTVEIINTDAEGRLILADALDYANNFDPQAVIDIATLTGAALYVLGYAAAPVIGNNDELMKQIEEASVQTAERTWRMPLWDDYREAMRSNFADLVNSGGRPAGTLTASAFLENFIGKWPWAHIDIAYMDNEPKGRPYVPKGASGYGVRLLVEVLSNWKRPR